MRPAAEFPAPPAHGYRGEPESTPLTRPQGLSVAISRESGARGGSIARKVGEILGWQVFDQETIDYLIQTDSAREQLLAEIPPAALGWTHAHFHQLQHERKLTADPDTAAMIRLLLAVAARGDVVIVGRGAGFLLPADTTLHVRVVAPIESRVVYFAQWMRLNREEAVAEVRARDERRTRYLARVLGRDPTDATGYDFVVNSSRLGVEEAAHMIAWAAKAKRTGLNLDDADGPDGPSGAAPLKPR